MKYRLRRQAEVDLEEIWSYTATRWGLDQAERYVGGILQMLDFISENPRLGRWADEVRPGYRKKAIGSRIIFYREQDAAIDVVRVLHQSMDLVMHIDP